MKIMRTSMEGSCCADESTISDSISFSPDGLSHFQRPPIQSLESLHRCVGSGASVIIESESGIEAESRKLPSSKYKGVVPQPNGRWGAQIYEKHQRVWLGTFNEENEAAKAYDIAAFRFRGRDAMTNFIKTVGDPDKDEAETFFLNSHSKAEIVDMLRKHTYGDELEQSKKKYCTGCEGGNQTGTDYNQDLAWSFHDSKSREQLFDKIVTPSDVGKLNRLVIPKQHAEKHFPFRVEGCGITKGILLNLEDFSGKVWRFRYSYWNSSQSYVLTKGWSRFVKEKSLKAGDVVIFQRSTGEEKKLFIDHKPKQTNLFQTSPVRPVPILRLFGVNIFNGSCTGFIDGPARTNEMMVTRREARLNIQCQKKQRIAEAL